MSTGPDLTDAKRRLVEHLKRVEVATAADIARTFDLTDAAVRQHLDALEVSGIVERTAAPSPGSGRGRPPTHWRLTTAATDLFPDRHGDLSVDLLEGIRSTLGDDALRAVIDARADEQRSVYAQVVGNGTTPVATRVQRLADRRTEEGYLAEVHDDGDGWVLVQHHCPIADAASACDALCSAELDVFRRVLGDGVTVERDAHLLAGDRRCSYRVRATDARPVSRSR